MGKFISLIKWNAFFPEMRILYDIRNFFFVNLFDKLLSKI